MVLAQVGAIYNALGGGTSINTSRRRFVVSTTCGSGLTQRVHLMGVVGRFYVGVVLFQFLVLGRVMDTFWDTSDNVCRVTI